MTVGCDLASLTQPIAPSLSAKIQDVHYDFSDQTLHDDFQWLRVPDANELFSLAERDDALRLFGRDSLGSFFYSALVARRQQHFSYEATTKIEFAPADFQPNGRARRLL